MILIRGAMNELSNIFALNKQAWSTFTIRIVRRKHFSYRYNRNESREKKQIVFCYKWAFYLSFYKLCSFPFFRLKTFQVITKWGKNKIYKLTKDLIIISTLTIIIFFWKRCWNSLILLLKSNSLPKWCLTMILFFGVNSIRWSYCVSCFSRWVKIVFSFSVNAALLSGVVEFSKIEKSESLM